MEQVLPFIFQTIPERTSLSLLTLNQRAREILLQIGIEENNTVELVEHHHFLQLTMKQRNEEFWNNLVIGASELQDEALIKLACENRGSGLIVRDICQAISLNKTIASEYLIEKQDYMDKLHENMEIIVFIANTLAFKLLLKYGKESLEMLKSWSTQVFRNACSNGDISSVKFLNDWMNENEVGYPMKWSHALAFSCISNHRKIIDLSLSHNPDVNQGLWGACTGGWDELVEEMIDLGATEFLPAFSAACKENKPTTIDLMKRKGAQGQCNTCGKSIDEH